MISTVSALDHLVVVAATLEQGAACIEKTLGVRPAKGGEHIKIGTHNCVLRLADETYLEVIAVNPLAGILSRPRWFGMDDAIQRRKAAAGPYLATFVARTGDIDACADALPELGTVHDMQRGALHWRITIPDDGGLIHNGAVPAFIQWAPRMHPSQAMHDSGCKLLELEIRHPQPWRLAAIWRRAGLHPDERLTIREAAPGVAPGLIARISTPNGIATLY